MPITYDWRDRLGTPTTPRGGSRAVEPDQRVEGRDAWGASRARPEIRWGTRCADRW